MHFSTTKGGVGKTTLVVNIADALIDQGKKVLLVDADPQCNLSSFFLEEGQLDDLLGGSEDEDGETIWSAIRPVVNGKGPIKEIMPYTAPNGVLFCPGDVSLAEYEEYLPEAWTSSFARRERGYDVMCALSRAVRAVAKTHEVDVIIYDMGPNVGPLNRTILLDVDYFATPVAADLFSLRALSTVGRLIAKWILDWKTVRQIAPPEFKKDLLKGWPVYLGYVTSAYKVASGRVATRPHEYWEGKIAPRVKARIVEDLKQVDESLVPYNGNKLGAIKNFQSLAPEAQKLGLAIGKLKGHVNGCYYQQIDEAGAEFRHLAREILKRLL